MQEQQYENSSSESERASERQSTRDRWSEGEKLLPEPQRLKKRGKLSPLAIIVSVIVLLLVVFLLGGVMYALVAHSAVHTIVTQPAVPPIQKP